MNDKLDTKNILQFPCKLDLPILIRFIRAISFNVEIHNEHFIHAHTVNSILLQYENLLIDFPSTSIEHSVLEGDDSVGDNSEISIVG